MPSLEAEIPAFAATLSRLLALFESAPESVVGVQPRPGDWSVKQIACHLIDSASNNHQRFTRLQRTARLEFPPYEPEAWVAVEKSEGLAWTQLLGLLGHYNAFILHLARNLDPACLGHVWVVDGQEKTLEFLVRDYYRHLDWHITHLEKRLHEVSAG
ncbi:MAG TPA: DinB family protein [Polyangia bacterium]|jgi:hypothetical protein|nr:DinB family protein [Polyangia bacterium]